MSHVLMPPDCKVLEVVYLHTNTNFKESYRKFYILAWGQKFCHARYPCKIKLLI